MSEMKCSGVLCCPLAIESGPQTGATPFDEPERAERGRPGWVQTDHRCRTASDWLALADLARLMHDRQIRWSFAPSSDGHSLTLRFYVPDVTDETVIDLVELWRLDVLLALRSEVQS